MAIKGLSIPVCGNYNLKDGVVSYTEPFIADKAVEYSATFTVSDNTPLFGDNTIAENDKGTFQSGELELTTTDFQQELSLKVLGTKTNSITYGNGKTVTEEVFDDDQVSPYLGFGIIESHQVNNVDKYKAIFFPKVFFNVPEGAATTRGDAVEWQTSKIKATIMRSEENTENSNHPWIKAAWFDKEVDALEYLMVRCGKEQTE